MRIRSFFRMRVTSTGWAADPIAKASRPCPIQMITYVSWSPAFRTLESCRHVLSRPSVACRRSASTRFGVLRHVPNATLSRRLPLASRCLMDIHQMQVHLRGPQAYAHVPDTSSAGFMCPGYRLLVLDIPRQVALTMVMRLAFKLGLPTESRPSLGSRCRTQLAWQATYLQSSTRDTAESRYLFHGPLPEARVFVDESRN